MHCFLRTKYFSISHGIRPTWMMYTHRLWPRAPWVAVVSQPSVEVVQLPQQLSSVLRRLLTSSDLRSDFTSTYSRITLRLSCSIASNATPTHDPNISLQTHSFLNYRYGYEKISHFGFCHYSDYNFRLIARQIIDEHDDDIDLKLDRAN